MNVLTHPWIPLEGHAEPASFVELMCGEKDAVDTVWPRDDFRFYTRLLLSALVQALFPARTLEELRKRIDTPMTRAEVEARVAQVAEDFELIGGKQPFLQSGEFDRTKKGAARFVFGDTDLFVPAAPVDALGYPTALVALFVEQTYAGGGGSGHSTGPAGQPGALTLVDPGSLRRAAWASSLALDANDKAADAARPWNPACLPKRTRGAIGLVSGLFFQPRAILLEPADAGCCSFTGTEGPTVRLMGFGSKHGLDKDKTTPWVHPCAPMAVNSQGLAAVRLRADRPAWTGLAQVLAPISKQKSRTKHPKEGPAAVVSQWKAAFPGRRATRIWVLDFDRDKAKVKRCFFEAYPLSSWVIEHELPRLRALVEDAEHVERSLRSSLKSAHDDQKRGGFGLVDAAAEFWAATESSFVRWLAVVNDESATDGALDEVAERTRKECRTIAVALFDEHVKTSEWDARKMQRVATARRELRRSLFGGKGKKGKNVQSE